MRINRTSVANTLLTCPQRLRASLSASGERQREKAANELARMILADIGIDDGAAPDPNQLPLAL